MDAMPQLKEMSETLRGTSNKRNTGFIKISSPILYIYTLSLSLSLSLSLYVQFIHSFCKLSYEMSIVSNKLSSPQGAI